MRLDGYVRVSQVAGREGDSFISPEVQRQQIEGWAKLRGVSIVAWHVDLDESGGKLQRPGLDAMMERLRSGETEGIAVSRLDRLSRANVGDALRLVQEVADHGGKISVVDLGIDPTTIFGEFAMTIMLALARMEHRRLTESWQIAQERSIARGVPMGPTPFGYKRDESNRFVPSDEAPVTREAFRIAGASGIHAATSYLQEHSTRPDRKSVV